MEESAIFHPAKRRRFIRQHVPTTEEKPRILQPEDAPASHDFDHDPEELGVSEILRLRRQQRPRMAGVQFLNTNSGSSSSLLESTALVSVQDSADRYNAIADRFVGHSGQVVDVDKHMVAYIDSELAKRRTASEKAAKSSHNEEVESVSTGDSDARTEQPPIRQPASLGLLKEITLNPNEAQPRSNEPPPLKPRRPRLDRFGRPLPPRKPRKGRTGEDIARDKLVEDIMNESGLDVYQRDSKPPGQRADDSGDADSRLASQFQQDYIDAMQSRQSQLKKAIPGADPGQKGPKLGGSRQQRAAMRERELKDEKAKGRGG